ncbi:ATP synthase F1 subunit delta [Natronoflexus pectinivorans]|uniref:ATP synthase subunit delta n=1 Tax=Natronoflexus pectinivorans TaxID=682526 RepID=A0A4R2GPB0_9BACT|nr:ATP synthase F1 subunit delta [Natronoflexus pectinivorans]TCO10907.1 ATP synthase F1 delta subunit [Natronoflexus pectinivorans]
MNVSLISARYANSLFLVGKDDALLLDSIYIDCSYLKNMIKESADLAEFLKNSLIKPGKKVQVFKGIFGKQIHEYTLRFVEIIIQNHRETLLENILRNFINQYRQYKGIKTVTVITALPIPEIMFREINETIGRQMDCVAELECRVNEDIIGGLILMVDGRMVDGSVSGQLRSLKKKLLTNLKFS